MDEILVNDSWSEDQINGIENRLLQGIIGCRTYEAVEAATSWAEGLKKIAEVRAVLDDMIEHGMISRSRSRSGARRWCSGPACVRCPIPPLTEIPLGRRGLPRPERP